MSTSDAQHPNTKTPSSPLRPILLDIWSGKRLVLAVLVTAAVAYLVFRGTPAVVFLLSRLKDIGVTLVLAAVLAYVIAPVVNALCVIRPFTYGRLGRGAATILVLLGTLVALGLLGVFTADPIVEETVRLYGLLETWLKDAPEHLQRFLDAYAAAALPPEITSAVTAWARQRIDDVVGYVGQMAVGVVLQGWYVIEVLLVPVLTFYFVTDADRMRDGVLRAVPEAHRERIAKFLADANRALHGYVRGQLILCIIAAIITSTALYLLGVRVYLTLGLLVGLARAVPVIGPIVAAIPIIAISWIQVDAEAAAIALLVLVIMHWVESKLIMPNVLGHEAALHPVTVIIALLVGGEFFGVLGMFVAVPVVAIARLAVLHWQPSKSKEESASEG
ncbi:MAG: AI-2E family transporter [Candidatus Zipacnadales bacterium]